MHVFHNLFNKIKKKRKKKTIVFHCGRSDYATTDQKQKSNGWCATKTDRAGMKISIVKKQGAFYDFGFINMDNVDVSLIFVGKMSAFKYLLNKDILSLAQSAK